MVQNNIYEYLYSDFVRIAGYLPKKSFFCIILLNGSEIIYIMFIHVVLFLFCLSNNKNMRTAYKFA